jgi:hypothetical protein
MMPTLQSVNGSTASSYLNALANIAKVAEGTGILFGLWQLWLGRKERRNAEAKAEYLARKAANYQAWQVVNSAHGKGGSGGRIDALQDLVANNVSLAGVNLDGAWLESIALKDATLHHASLRGTCRIGADLSGASLESADLTDADLSGVSLKGAFLRRANLSGALLGTADLAGADLQGITGWERIASISYANIDGIRNPPARFVAWAVAQGAVKSVHVDAATSATHGFSEHFRSI